MNTQELRQTIADLVEEEPGDIGPDTNLFELGLDSISMMKLVNGWRRDGVDVSFAALAAEPTLEAWTRLVAGGGAAEPVATVEIADDVDEFPLGLMQYAYWIGREDGQQLGGVAAHLYTEFDGHGVDPARLRAAFDKLVARHEMLRAQLTDNGAQVVLSATRWPGLVVHVSPDLDEIRERLSHQKLDIEAGQVFSAELSLLPDGATRLHLDIDMVAADAVSYRILLSELARFYLDPELELPPVGYSYRQYRLAKRAPREVSAKHWQDRLATLPGAPTLPVGQGGAPSVARRHFTLDRESLYGAAKRRGLTPAMAMATAFAEVIGRWSATPHFLLNVPLFDREPQHPAVGEVVGDFSSSVMLEVDLRQPATFLERARQLQTRMHTDAAFADYSGVEVLRDLTRRQGTQVLAPVVFTSALNLGDLFDSAVKQAFGSPVWIVSQGPQVLLDAQITEVADGILVNWDTREEQFQPGVLDEMFAAFRTLVGELAAEDAAWDAVSQGSTVDSPAVDETASATEKVTPSTDLERVVALVWADVLGVAEVGVTDEFFALGGDSVLAASIITQLREGLDTSEVSVRMLFATPTVAGLVGKMLEAEQEPGRLAQVAEIYLEIESMTDEDVAAELEVADGGR